MLNRKAIVQRHNAKLKTVDYQSPFTLGNGSFAFTADVTGLQSFPDLYLDNGIPLCTQSSWGWHSFENSENLKVEDAIVMHEVDGRSIPYLADMYSLAGQWFRNSPHLLELARIGFEFHDKNDELQTIEAIESIDQTLDCWNGELVSRFKILGEEVLCRTSCHPEKDQIAFVVQSALLKTQQLKVRFRFPYGSIGFRIGKEEWEQPEKHRTTVRSDKHRFNFQRELDQHIHYIEIQCGSCEFDTNGVHDYTLTPQENDEFECCVAFASNEITDNAKVYKEVAKCSQQHWNAFWKSGAAIDFSSCTDPRAFELERRVVLSQYLTAAQCTADTPPQETGLTCNSWHGKFHLEMHWWHGVHFAYWNRLPFLEKTLPWYKKIMTEAKKVASIQGYDGVRWPKQVASDGVDSPSTCGPYLIWQQPHPIYYAELCYRKHSDQKTLKDYSEIVFETAAFMASYVQWDEVKQRYTLGPMMIPAQECYDPKTTLNPPFELSYWHWGLSVAQSWRERLGLSRHETWDHVIENLAKLPVKDGCYETAEGHWKTKDHPSLVGAFGIVPGYNVDMTIMANTLDKVIEGWQWDETWGWDFPMMAMSAARLGKPDTAIDFLLYDTPKNTYCNNGHNYQGHHLPLYLPGNGGLLTAVAMMAAGWDGGDSKTCPGFPSNGKWEITWEGFQTKI
jgi:protein-glucosylgalactosylhydroxylysine glucosidase